MPIVANQFFLALGNTNFEAGAISWKEFSLRNAKLVVKAETAKVAAHSGFWITYLAGLNKEVSFINQKITLPRQQAGLQYWHWISSNDECGYDFGGVLVNNVVVDNNPIAKSGIEVKNRVRVNGPQRGHGIKHLSN